MKNQHWQAFSLFPVLLLVMLMAVFLVGCATHRISLTVAAPAPGTVALLTAPSLPAMLAAMPSMSAPEATSSTSSERGTRSGEDTASGEPPTSADSMQASLEGFEANGDLRDIHFDFDKHEIRPGDADILGENAIWIKENTEYLVLIEGHCDERGTKEYNLALGERRAKATKSYLVSEGVEASRIRVVSYGKERPLCTKKTKKREACWSENRRAHFLVKAP